LIARFYDAATAELLKQNALIDRLLGDEALSARLGAIATRLQASPGTVTAADLIERVAR
jgi:hypothetical protein